MPPSNKPPHKADLYNHVISHIMLYPPSSLFIPMKDNMATTNTKRDEISIANAPHVITPACFKIIGIAMLPTAEAPVRNLVASTQLL